MLTLEQFNEIPDGEVFADGIIKNNPEGFFVTRENLDRDILWIAQKGFGEDFTIYYGWAEPQEGDPEGVPVGMSMIITNGDKMYNKEIIRKVLPMEDEVFSKYRY